ncbi:hypothetical protein [Streptomyces sp. ODS05-4]|uniref:hypothetical protein n=1 Tax=Streptomyces sp. ODS05-4 TaxID=2944939 RepID=UPI0035AFD230
MRGLSARDHTGGGRGPGRTGGGDAGGRPHGVAARTGRWAAAPAALAVAAVFALLACGCSAGGTGTRDEGAARADAIAPTSAPQSTGVAGSAPRKIDPVRLVLDDPAVSKRVKDDLKPCAEDSYPVDTSYGDLTGSAVPDIVVNVLTCGDAVGVGTYVYRSGARDPDAAADAAGYRNVFAREEPAVYSAIDRGDLVVTQQVYADDDPVAYPSGEDVITYRWAGSRFTEHDRVHNDYSPPGGAAPGDETAEQDAG